MAHRDARRDAQGNARGAATGDSKQLRQVPKLTAHAQLARTPTWRCAEPGLRSRPPRDDKSQTKWGHHDKVTDLQQHPDLMGDDSFYSVLRKRVVSGYKGANAIKKPRGRPPLQQPTLVPFPACALGDRRSNLPPPHILLRAPRSLFS